jgi:hypothetical protein
VRLIDSRNRVSIAALSVAFGTSSVFSRIDCPMRSVLAFLTAGNLLSLRTLHCREDHRKCSPNAFACLPVNSTIPLVPTDERISRSHPSVDSPSFPKQTDGLVPMQAETKTFIEVEDFISA